MGLTGNALRAAVDLLANFPEAKITSGRRTIAEQVRAMAQNIMQSRSWVKDTYMPSKASRLCQDWLDKHPAASISDISVGLGTILRGLADDELGKLSKHLSGHAFDVKPIDGDLGVRLKSFLRMLADKYSGKFLEKEGDLVRWHWQA